MRRSRSNTKIRLLVVLLGSLALACARPKASRQPAAEHPAESEAASGQRSPRPETAEAAPLANEPPEAIAPPAPSPNDAEPPPDAGAGRVSGIDMPLSTEGDPSSAPPTPSGGRLYIPYTDAGADFCAMEIVEADGTRKPHRPPSVADRCRARWQAGGEAAGRAGD